MTFFRNRDLNQLLLHSTLHVLAFSFCDVFAVVFLLRVGFSVPGVFIVFAAILTLRFALRPLVLIVAPRVGLRRTLMFGTLVYAFQFPMLALVHGEGTALVLYCFVSAFGQVFYWTAYHAYFAAIGDAKLRGTQVAGREVLNALAGILGPASGGLVLALFGPWPAFLTASAIEIAAIAPLYRIAEPVIVAKIPGGLYPLAKTGIWLFVSDGWIISSAATAWSIIMFRAAGGRYDTFGGLLAVAALAAAVSGMLLGRFIDRGHARRVIWASSAIMAASLVLKAVCGEGPVAVILVAIITTMLSGLYIPILMTAVYNEGKRSRHPLQFQFAAEGGWDAGGAISCLVSAGLCAAGLPLQLAFVIGLPLAAVQVRLLMASYERTGGDRRTADIVSSPHSVGEIQHR